MQHDPYNHPRGAPPPWPQPGAMPHAPPKSNAGLIIGLVVGAVFLFMMFAGGVGVALFMRAKTKAKALAPSATKTVWSDATSPIPVTSDDPMRGERDALVTIVVFSDFQCPFCGRLGPTLDTVRARYGSEVRVIWKNQPLPFHVNAKPAAEAAQGVFELKGSDAFWRFHDQCFANQSALSQTNYEAWAQLEGVDVATFSRGLASHRWRPKVDEDARLANDVGARGTPTSFINGIKLAGAQPVSAFERAIDGELVKARSLVAAGTPRDRVYVERSRVNFNAPALGDTPAEPAVDADANKIFPVPVGASPVRGPATALVTVIEFGDYQCPFCKRAEVSMDRLRTEYPADVRFVFKQQPLAFHPRAEPAAQLALEARAQRGDAAYFIAHDKLFASQPALESSDLLGIARSMGLDEGRVSTAILTKKHKSTIDAESKLANGFGATGTPTFFINGRKLTGAQPYERFKAIVDEEIPKARAKLASGTPRSSLYDEIVGLR
ncbi:MAG: thioredoxin domain-containing protein [Labilithrix sp.]|nr:thioredoxin domain-containing protein [Labilithrix sp.]